MNSRMLRRFIYNSIRWPKPGSVKDKLIRRQLGKGGAAMELPFLHLSYDYNGAGFIYYKIHTDVSYPIKKCNNYYKNYKIGEEFLDYRHYINIRFYRSNLSVGFNHNEMQRVIAESRQEIYNATKR